MQDHVNFGTSRSHKKLSKLGAAERLEWKEVAPPAPLKRPYRAVVYVYMDGGVDSHNLFVPLEGCGDKDLFAEYTAVRTIGALAKERLLPVNTSGSPIKQPCSTLGVHDAMPLVHSLYNDGDVAVLGNIGPLVEPIASAAEYHAKTKEVPFSIGSHSSQTEVVQSLHAQQRDALGVLGRLLNALGQQQDGDGGTRPFKVRQTLTPSTKAPHPCFQM